MSWGILLSILTKSSVACTYLCDSQLSFSNMWVILFYGNYWKAPSLHLSWLWPQGLTAHTWPCSVPGGKGGGRWTLVSRAWTYFDSAGCVVYCHFVSRLYWSVIVMHDHVTSHCEAFHGHTYLEFVDLLRRLLTKINRCHACLVSTLHCAQRAGHTLCGQTFHSSSSISNTTGIWRKKSS